MNLKQLFWVVFLVSAIALVGCEGDTGPQGPTGPPGADGSDGVAGTAGRAPAVCMECHSDATFVEVALEYMQSGHNAGEYVAYAGGRASCARCHSKQGFVEFVVMGEVAENIVDPAPIDCSTCHAVHPSTFQLRLAEGTEMIADPTYTIDFGDNSNVCANCHQSRTAEPNIAAPGDEFEITSIHYGPHHGPQAIILEGVGMAEIAGSTAYPAPSGASGHLSQDATCVTCHMASYSDNAGGHSWHPNLNSCTGCHPGATDFDMNDRQTITQEKLDELRDLLMARGVIEFVEADQAYEPVTGTYPMVEVQAYFNWIGITEDRSLGVHNPRYITALLNNTIEALTP